MSFINHLYFPYDRVAIVTFDSIGQLVLPLTNTLTLADAADVVRNLQVSPPRDPPYCRLCQNRLGTDPSGCTNTSIGGGLKLAGGEFGRQPIRQESLWVVILLTDGVGQRHRARSGRPRVVNAYCPPSTWAT